jgi:hypothetical protein
VWHQPPKRFVKLFSLQILDQQIINPQCNLTREVKQTHFISKITADLDEIALIVMPRTEYADKPPKFVIQQTFQTIIYDKTSPKSLEIP